MNVYKMKKLSYLVSLFFTLLVLNPNCIAIASEKENSIIRAAIAKKTNLQDSDISQDQNTDQEYILGQGDIVMINFEYASELSRAVAVQPNGLINLPRINSIRAEGLSIPILRKNLIKEYEKYIIKPLINIYIVKYRPLSIYGMGEVSRPGLYQVEVNFKPKNQSVDLKEDDTNEIDNFGNSLDSNSYTEGSINVSRYPDLFTALQTFGGVTTNADLSNIEVIRTISSNGNEIKKKANLNLLSMLKTGDQSQNIRLYDKDIIKVGRLDKSSNKDSSSLITQTNLNPQTINVFITGRVQDPGKKILPNGILLSQAVIASGGTKTFRGKVEFIRFKNGIMDIRKVKYNQNNLKESYSNPILMDGDIISFKNNIFSSSLEVIKEIGAPFIGINAIKSVTQ